MGLLTMTSAVERCKSDLAKLIVARAKLEVDDVKGTSRLLELRGEEARQELEALINGTEPVVRSERSASEERSVSHVLSWTGWDRLGNKKPPNAGGRCGGTG